MFDQYTVIDKETGRIDVIRTFDGKGKPMDDRGMRAFLRDHNVPDWDVLGNVADRFGIIAQRFTVWSVLHIWLTRGKTGAGKKDENHVVFRVKSND